MRKSPRLVVALVVVSSTIASAAQPAPRAQAQIPEMGTCLADAELVVGSEGGSVVCVQWALAWLGFYRGLVSGQYDDPTFLAVIDYQRANTLRVNGHADADTLTAMGIYSGVDNAPPPPCLADAPVRPGDRGPSAECVQQTLAASGWYSGEIDGAFGADSQDALQAFQSASPPLVADGVADTQTLAALGIWSGFTRGDGAAPPVLNWWPATVQAEPNWRTVQGIPYFYGRRACSRADADTIATEFAKDGADPATQQYFIYIASREGGCRFDAVNLNLATKDDSHCTFQLNALAGMFHPNAELGRRGWTAGSVKTSMQHCADAASDLWVFCSRGPWTPPYGCTPPWKGDLGPDGDV